jgi:hypothetical protein
MIPSLSDASRSKSSGISRLRGFERSRLDGVDAGLGPISFV